MMLSKTEFARYRKQIMLDDFGLTGQTDLRGSHVLVVGAGGLGCPILQYLCAAGVGCITVADFDVVEVSNLHRQVLFTEENIGQFKVEVATRKLSEQNPFIEIRSFKNMISAENADELIAGCDIVVDGCDNFLTRYIVNDACHRINKPLVYGSILGYEGQIALFSYEGSKNLRNIFPEPPSPEEVPDCSENGVLGVVPAIIGSMMALETINVILKRPSLVNTLLIYNCLTHTSNRIGY